MSNEEGEVKAQEPKQQQTPDDSCDIDNFQKVVKEQDNVLVVITKEGCPACEATVPRIPDEFPDNVAIIEVPTENGDNKCDILADALEVPVTPAIIAYHKGQQISAKPIVQIDPEKDEDPIVATKKLYKEHGIELGVKKAEVGEEEEGQSTT